MKNINISSFRWILSPSQYNFREISIKFLCLMTGNELHYRYTAIIIETNLDLRSIMIWIRFSLTNHLTESINQQNAVLENLFAEFNMIEQNLFDDMSGFHRYIDVLKIMLRELNIPDVSVLFEIKKLSINRGCYDW